jgi:serralysin
MKNVFVASQGNLWNAADMYGMGNDTLNLLLPAPNHAAIRTYLGNDVVNVLIEPTGSSGYKFYLGLGNDTLSASAKDDYYYDEGGDDVVNMGAGHDVVYAGPGNDTINGGSDSGMGDTLYFSSQFDMFGNSTPVTQGVTFDLAVTGPQDLGFFGTDTIFNFEDVSCGPGDDTIHGNNLGNVLLGWKGDDFISGRGGDDSILGGEGNDTLIGGPGADHLYAGTLQDKQDQTDGDADIIKYFQISDSTYDGGMDTILEFEHAAGGGDDRIDLSSIDANTSLGGNQTFQFVGSAGFSMFGGSVRVTTVGGNSVVMVNNDSDAIAEMVIIVDGVTGLTADDFIL